MKISTVAVVVSSYALGCLTAGQYLVQLRTGEDLRRLGTGTVGARNAGRRLGPSGFVATAALDTLKGSLAVFAARRLARGNEGAAPWAAVMVTAGHIWPFQLGFRGGKGIATSLGALGTLEPRLVLPFVALAGSLAAAGKDLTLATLGAILSLPLLAALRGIGGSQATAVAATSALTLLAHRDNLRASFWPAMEATGPPLASPIGDGR